MSISSCRVLLTFEAFGRGEPLFAGIDLPCLGYRVTETVATDLSIHIVLKRRSEAGRGE